MKKKIPRRAKLIGAGGFYQYVPLNRLDAKIIVPVMRRVSLNEPAIDYSETWHFQLVFGLRRVLTSYVEYEQIDCIKVKTPTTITNQVKKGV